jgi:hypothetical protein
MLLLDTIMTSPRSFLTRTLASLAFGAFLAGCPGKVALDTHTSDKVGAGGATNTGSSAAGGAGGATNTRNSTTAGGVSIEPGTNGCISVTLSPQALACSTDQDCTGIENPEGSLCLAASPCGNNGAVNNAAATAINSAEMPLQTGIACPCIFIPGEQVRCLAGQCTTCRGTASDPSGCAAAETLPSGDSDGGDAGDS